MSEPLLDGSDVTVLIPVRNRAAVLRRALASVGTQTVAPAEILVVDDASDDGAPAEAARSGGARVLRLPERRGAAGARNAGLDEVSTPWVAFLDSDDEWLPDHLASLLAEREGLVLLAAPGWRLPAGRVVGHAGGHRLELTPQRLLVPSNPVTTSGAMARRDAVLAAGGFSGRTHAEDLELWVSLLDQGRGAVLARPTVVYHEHAEQASSAQAAMREHARAVLHSFADRPWWSPRLVGDFEAVLAWDDLRSALRTRGGVPGAALAVLRSLPRWRVLADLLVDRYRSRHFRVRP